jgi:hypothetical protein
MKSMLISMLFSVCLPSDLIGDEKAILEHYFEASQRHSLCKNSDTLNDLMYIKYGVLNKFEMRSYDGFVSKINKLKNESINCVEAKRINDDFYISQYSNNFEYYQKFNYEKEIGTCKFIMSMQRYYELDEDSEKLEWIVYFLQNTIHYTDENSSLGFERYDYCLNIVEKES